MYDSPIIQYHLKISFILISNIIEWDLHNDELNYLISICLKILQNINDIKTIENYQKILYSIRLISNLLSKYSITYKILESSLEIENFEIEICKILNQIFEWDNNELIREVIWFLKNLLTNEFCSNKDCIMKNLKIKRMNILSIKK